MNKWYALTIILLILSIVLIRQDASMDNLCYKYFTEEGINCIILQEIYDPFIWVSGILAIGFSICGLIEYKTKKR